MGIGLQPLFQSLQTSSASSLLGVVEPWEVWWSRNRDKYISFREDIQWVKTLDQGGTKSITVYPAYDELINILSDELVRQDNSGCMACSAAIALGKIIDPQNPTSSKIVAALKKAIETKMLDCTCNRVLLASGITGDISFAIPLKEILLDKKESSLRRSYAALGLGFISNDTEIPKILKKILSENDDSEVKCYACISLGNLKDVSSVSVLGEILNSMAGSKNKQLRTYAALGLGRIGNKEALDELKKSTPVSEKEADVRAAVVVALGMTGLPEAKNSIISFLTDKRDSKISGLAAIVLTEIKDAKSYDIISDALRKNKSFDADGLMVLALGLTADERAKADLRKILENKKSRPLLKSSAAIGLGLLKDTGTVPIIVNMLKNDKQLNDPILTPYLILSLGMIGDPKGIEPLQTMWGKIGYNTSNLAGYHTNLAVALTMLGKRDEVVLPRLFEQVNQSNNPFLKSYALHTLGLVGNKESAQVFIQSYKDKNGYVRFTTINSIGFLLDKNSISPLARVTADNIDAPMRIMDEILSLRVW
ncbi:MAG: HEAT repeat domain-containing protein [Planctomycetota bacterium]